LLPSREGDTKGQVRHGSAATTHAVRAAIQRSTASIAALSRKYGVNPKTVAKWKQRDGVSDAPMGPKEPRSTVLGKEEEALAVAFRRHTLLPLDDCLYALHGEAAARHRFQGAAEHPASDAVIAAPTVPAACHQPAA
jgi:transposase-like protein